MSYMTLEQANREAAQREARRNPVASEMTLRDYFAAKAMQGIVNNSDAFWAGAAPLAYQYADAMLEARNG